MIDYDKLKIANELAKQIKYETRFNMIDNVNALSDFGRFFFSASIYLDDDIAIYHNLDDTIAKLQELTQPKPKYATRDIVYFVSCDGGLRQEEIDDYCSSDNTYFINEERWFEESEVFPTKQSLIEHQIEYWRDQISEELEQHISPYCEPLNKEEHCQVSGAKLNTPKIEAVPYHPIFTDEKILDSIKCEHGFSPRNCFECVMGICQHENDGLCHNICKGPDGSKWESKCKKCGEFYK